MRGNAVADTCSKEGEGGGTGSIRTIAKSDHQQLPTAVGPPSSPSQEPRATFLLASPSSPPPPEF